jgi:aminoglycoside 2'-N-acetyltransferase I
MRYKSGFAMQQDLGVSVAHADDVTPDQKESILALCNRAYGEDLTSLLATFSDPTHVLGFQGGILASHALWVTRWLQPGNDLRLRTAYIEMVATEPDSQRRGFATAIMRHVYFSPLSLFIKR